MPARRSFLQQLLAGGASLALGAFLRARPADARAISPGRRLLLSGDSRGALVMTDLERGTCERIPTHATPHAILAHPRRPGCVVFVEKYGIGAGIVDLAQRREVTSLALEGRRHHGGHGLFLPDGRTLVIPESEIFGGRGTLALRDGDTLKKIGELDAYTREPHDIQLLPDGKTLLVAGADPETRRGGLVWIDVAGGKLLERRALPDPGIHATHFAMDRRGHLLVTGAPIRPGPGGAVADGSPGGVFFRRGDALVAPRIAPEARSLIRGEVVSVAIDEERQVACTTNPKGSFVGLFSTADGSLLAHHPIPESRGVVLTDDRRHFLVSTGAGRLVAIDTATLALAERFVGEATVGDGSHMVHWS